jgi:N-acetyl-1-D-myo-inositol-2-amino-2-deoxy-alpha-D-glucopyranoside deacetylase
MLPPLLFVHAHPDDETLTTGVAMAHYVRVGHPVHLLTCTLGDEGEVIPGELADLASTHADTLGSHRREELREAMAVLGVQHRVLGEDPVSRIASRYRDSGMAGTPSAANPSAFVNADLDEAATLVADVVRELGPSAVITYDRNGGYRHPDHIQTHRVTCAALASLDDDLRPPLFAVLTPRSWAREDRQWLARHRVAAGDEGAGGDGGDSRWLLPDPDGDYPASVVDDVLVTHELVFPELVPVQAEALRRHRTQVTVAADGLSYALSNDVAARLSGREGYAAIDPTTGDLAENRGDPRHTGLVPEPAR